METLADKINNALKNGRTIMASVYNGSTQFGPKWAGRFSMDKNGNVLVNRGKRVDCYLACGTEFKSYK